MSLVWSYAVTTVPSRFETTLPTTLESMKKAGFDRPTLFIDGPITTCPEFLSHYPLVQRSPAIKAYGNWLLTIWELYIRSPLADRYAIFQDDFVTYLNLKSYLEASPYPKVGYLNLYTFPKNVQPHEQGWYRAFERGKGAVALVFDNKAAKTLITQPHLLDRLADPMRCTQGIDGAVHDAMAKAGFHEYVHNPSLVQHIGDVSSIHPSHNAFAKADTFRGEDYNAQLMSTTVSKPSTANQRIGLIGYLADTSLGRLNSAIASNLRIDRWLAKPHNKPVALQTNSKVNLMIDPSGSKLEKFIRHSDVIIFCGRLCYPNIIEYAQKYHRKVVGFKTEDTLVGLAGVDLWLEPPAVWDAETIKTINSQIKELE